MISLERIENPRVWDRRRRCVEADPAPSTRLVTDGSVGLGALALSKAKAIYCRGSGQWKRTDDDDIAAAKGHVQEVKIRGGRALPSLAVASEALYVLQLQFALFRCSLAKLVANLARRGVADRLFRRIGLGPDGA